MVLVDQPTAAPTRKITAVIVGGSAATILITILSMVFDVQFPSGFEAAVAVILSVAAGYFTKEEL